MATYGDTTQVPIFERWFLGGLYNMRGYKYQTRRPTGSVWRAAGGRHLLLRRRRNTASRLSRWFVWPGSTMSAMSLPTLTVSSPGPGRTVYHGRRRHGLAHCFAALAAAASHCGWTTASRSSMIRTLAAVAEFKLASATPTIFNLLMKKLIQILADRGGALALGLASCRRRFGRSGRTKNCHRRSGQGLREFLQDRAVQSKTQAGSRRHGKRTH